MIRWRPSNDEFYRYAHDLGKDLAPHGVDVYDYSSEHVPDNTRDTTLKVTGTIATAITFGSKTARPNTLDMPTYKTPYGEATHSLTQQKPDLNELNYNFACRDAEPLFTLFAKAVRWRRIRSPVVLCHDNVPIGIMKGLPGSHGERTILGICDKAQADSPIHPSTIVEGDKITTKLLQEIQKSSKRPHAVHLEHLLYAREDPAKISITSLFNTIRLSAYSDPMAMEAMQAQRQLVGGRLTTRLLPLDNIREITINALQKGKIHEPTEKEIKSIVDRIQS